MNRLDRFWTVAPSVHDRGVWIYDEADGVATHQSYADLYEQAGCMAAALQKNGVGRGDLVPLCATSSRHFPALWLGMIWLGATPVPLPPRHAMANAATYQNRLESIFPCFDRYICSRAESRHALPVMTASKADCRVIFVEDLVSAALESSDAVPERVCAHADDIAFIQYTSGSTRSPKGIRVTYGNVFANIDAIISHLEISPESDVLISWLPLYHDMGLIGKFLTSLMNQNSLVLMPPHAFVRRPLRFLELIESHHATICSMPNFAYDLINRRLEVAVAKPSLKSMKWFGVGAEPVRVDTLSRFEELASPLGLAAGVLSPCYGLAEATLAVSMERPGGGYRVVDVDGRRYVTCGHLLDGFDLKMDAPSREIKIRGPSVATTALIDGEVRSIVDEDGFYGTKDTGVVIDGRLVIQGRLDEMFIINGENRFPYDIEALVRETVDEISRCVCVGIQDDSDIQRIVFLYERRDSLRLQDHDRKERIMATVLEHAGVQLDDVVALPLKVLPQTPSGKMQRVRAKELYKGRGQEERSAV
ncbi:MAG: AMP-binding protein [Lautropia sp.]|nr:AMP-binding protein [Lautropia sp.]